MLTLGAAALVVAAAALTLNAQSGRRMPKTPPPVLSSPLPATTEYEPAAPPKEAPKPDYILKVISDIDNINTPLLSTPQRVRSWTFERLRGTRLLDVRDAGAGNRSTAVKLAKADTEAYVVLLELKTDPLERYGRSSVRSLAVIVTVYNPNSGKVKLSRSMSVGQSSTRMPGSRAIMHSCYPGVYGDDVLLLEASIEAADTIMNSFSVPIPPLCRDRAIY